MWLFYFFLFSPSSFAWLHNPYLMKSYLQVQSYHAVLIFLLIFWLFRVSAHAHVYVYVSLLLFFLSSTLKCRWSQGLVYVFCSLFLLESLTCLCLSVYISIWTPEIHGNNTYLCKLTFVCIFLSIPSRLRTTL